MSEFTQQEIGLLSRSSWLLEQKLRTELEFEKIRPRVPAGGDFSHQAIIDIDGVSYYVEFKASVRKTDNVKGHEPKGSYGS